MNGPSKSRTSSPPIPWKRKVPIALTGQVKVDAAPGVGPVAPFERAGDGYAVKVPIEGLESRILFHLGAGPSVINTDLVERLELYPGGQGARYGRAIAGEPTLTMSHGSPAALSACVSAYVAFTSPGCMGFISSLAIFPNALSRSWM